VDVHRNGMVKGAGLGFNGFRSFSRLVAYSQWRGSLLANSSSIRIWRDSLSANLDGNAAPGSFLPRGGRSQCSTRINRVHYASTSTVSDDISLGAKPFSLLVRAHPG